MKTQYLYGCSKGLLSVALTVGIVTTVEQIALPAPAKITGLQVASVQRCLQRLGYFTGPVTGKYGNLTRSAIIRFQQANRLPAAGFIGPQTQRLLESRCRARNIVHNHNNYYSPYNNVELRLGSRGLSVSKLQQDLQILRIYTGPITGNFDSQTQQAVIQFQQTYGLPTDGVVGPKTQETIRIALNANLGYDNNSAFNNVYPASNLVPNSLQNNSIGVGGDSLPNALYLGSQGQLVTQLQQDLQQLGYFPSNSTGYFGSTTKYAVQRFQYDHQLTANGVADTQTLVTISRVLQDSQSSNRNCSIQSGDICPGEQSQRVILLQQRLRQRGFFNGDITGYYGAGTKYAVAQFQRYSGINSTGFVDFKTWQSLGLSNDNHSNGYHYTVVIPLKNQDTLYKVRQFVPNAFAAKSRLGNYVNAGGFRHRADAEKVSDLLRSRGLDARVEYF